MKANELRIGNLGLLKGKTIEIIGVFGEIFWYKSDGNTFSAGIEKIDPIPLTEEWLLCFGLKRDMIIFEKEKNSQFAVKKWQVGSSIEWLIFWGDNRLPKIEIQYVHQLQNLYWCLCGKELEINL